MKFVLFLLIYMMSLPVNAVMVATLEGYENDITADGRNVHIIVAGYGGEMGSLTYEMAISRAQKLKRDFPNERVVIVGSTPQKEGAISAFTPHVLEKKYDITLGYQGSDPFRNKVNEQMPLTGEALSGIILNLVTNPKDREEFKAANPNQKYNSSLIRKGIGSGQLSLSAKIASMDFMTHSSPISGIFLHDSNKQYQPINNKDEVTAGILYRNGFGLDKNGVLQITDRDKALKLLGSDGLSLDSNNQIVDVNGATTDFKFSTKKDGSTRRFSITSDGQLYEQKELGGGANSRMLEADSKNFDYLNGLFTPDAYVNVSGCSGGYGLIEDMSKVLGVPVNGSATGSLVEVMDQNGDFYYNYPASNPYGDGELSESPYGSRGNALSPSDRRSVVGLRADQRLYHGYWGVLKSGTNFVTSSCQIRSSNPEASEDRKRCEMGMARSMEDAMTSTNVVLKAGTLSFDDFTNVLIERMCPNGFSDRGYISESEKEVSELRGLKSGCVSAVRSLSYLNKNCSNQNPQYFSKLFKGEISEGQSAECRSEASQFIEKHRFYVPLTDRLGKTLFCSLEKGCEVELKGCEVTKQEEEDCSLVSSDKESQAYKSCMITKRCEIDESKTHASNEGNPTFMKFIQNYMNGYQHLKNYRSGQLDFVTKAPSPIETESDERLENRISSGYSGFQNDEMSNSVY
jgi:F420-dependent methylenetetrahydromethanopterin dehydrogenase